MHYYLFRRVLLFALFCYVLPTRAQINIYDRLDIASPTAGSLGKAIDFPVNPHTGIPKVSIPIYTIESGKLKVPISLDYHASGIKVLEAASWVGMNWSLNTGGILIRTVRGAPDEHNTSTVQNQNYGHQTEHGFSSYYLESNVQDWDEFAAGRKDGEPDMFYFTAGNYSGQFYISDNNDAVLVPDQDIKIVYNSLFKSCSITTPDGIEYRFGGGSETPVDIVNPFTAATGYDEGTVASAFYLRQIVADSVTAINFSYVPENYSYYTFTTPAIANSDVSNTQYAVLVKNYVKGFRLSNITFDNGRIDFVAGSLRNDLSGFTIKSMAEYANTDARSLAAIEIKNNNATYCRRFSLFTSYWYDGTTALPSMLTNQNIQTDRYRLRLDSLQESTCLSSASEKINPYKFVYYSELVPRRLTFAQDHWGYFNGAVSNTTMVPTITEKNDNGTITYAGADREPSFPAMRGGALAAIGYPTGGSHSFLMEGNRALVSDGPPVYNSVYTKNIGYDGSNPIYVEQSVTFSGGLYKATLSSSYLGNIAGLYVYNPVTNEYFISLTTPSSSTAIDQRYIPAGTWKVRLTKDNSNPTGNLTGVGASGDISLYAGTTGPSDTLVGGLRIYKENKYDALTGKMEETNYTYTSGVSPSGVLFSRPVYAQIIRNDQIAQYGDWSPVNGYTQSCSPQGCIACTGYTYMKCGQSIQPLTTSQGSHIGYSEVKVSKPGNGYVIYRYNTGKPYGYSVPSTSVKSVDRTSCVYSLPNYPAAPEPYDYLRGTPSTELYFSEDNRLLKEINYNDTYSGNYDSIPAFIATGIANRFLGTFYSVSTAKKITSRVVVTDYTADTANQAMSNETLTSYGSDEHCQPTQTTTVNSTGDSLVTKMKYAFDFSYQCNAQDTFFTNFRARCNSCQAAYTSAQNACSGQGGLCYTNAFLSFQKCMMTSRAIYANNYYWSRNASGDYFNCIVSSVNYQADSLLKPILLMKRSGENALIEKSDYKNNKLLKAELINYKILPYSNYVEYPSSIMRVNLAFPSSTFSPLIRSGNSITKDNRYVVESVSFYKGKNIVQAQAADAIPVAYIFDYNSRLPVAVASNAEESSIAYCSFEADGKGNWNFSGTPVTDATALTGSKSYAFNGNAITKTGLNSSKKYIVSYWTKGSVAYSITGTQGSAIKGETRKGWTYFQHIVTGVTSISISGTASIDELRLYPSDAKMVTYTYEPMLGMTSKCSDNDYVEYYEYNSLGKLMAIRDANGNLLKYYDYQYQKPVLSN